MRVRLLTTVLLLGGGLVLPPALADCIDYGDYLHWLSGVPLPGQAKGVVAAGDLVYVADGLQGLQVIDVADPLAPRVIGSIDTPGDACGVVLAGDVALVADGPYGLEIIDIADPTDLHIVGNAGTPGDADAVALFGSFAAVGCTSPWDGLAVVDISNSQDPQLVGSVALLSHGYGVAMSGTYAYVTCAFQFKVIDVSDPRNPCIVGSGALAGRDIAIAGDYAYVANYSHFYVVDIANPVNPQIIGTLRTSVALGVAVADSRAYVADNRLGLLVIDITDLHSPQLLGCAGVDGLDVAVAGNCAYVGELRGNGGDLQVVDVRNGEAPPTTGMLDLGWEAAISDVDLAGPYAYVTVEADVASLKAVRVDDPQSPYVDYGVDLPSCPYALDVDASGFYAYIADLESGLQVVRLGFGAGVVGSIAIEGWATGVTLAGGLAYVAAYKPLGGGVLDIIDVSKPDQPWRVGLIDLATEAFAVAVSNGRAYVATDELVVVDVTDPANPWIVGSVDTPAYGFGVAVQGDQAYVSGTCNSYYGPGHFSVVDVSDPANPTIVASIRVPGDARRLSLKGHHAYLADGLVGLLVIDVQDPADPQVVGNRNMGQAWGLRVAGERAYLTDDGKLWILPVNCEFSGVPGESEVPAVTCLEAFPNPTSSGVEIRLAPPIPALARMDIFDVAGRRVRSLSGGRSSAGRQRLYWDTRDDAGRAVASGTYLARVPAVAGMRTGWIMVLR